MLLKLLSFSIAKKILGLSCLAVDALYNLLISSLLKNRVPKAESNIPLTALPSS